MYTILNKRNYILLAFLGILIILGASSFLYQTLNGMGVTGLREPVVWGLYVVNFTFFMGLGAGILMYLTVISIQKGISEEFKFFSSVIAFISLSLAGVFILLDLGRIDRFYYIAIYPHPKSPLFWDFIVLNALLAMSAVYSYLSFQKIAPFKFQLLNIPALFIGLVFKKANDLALRIGSFITLFLITALYFITTKVFTDTAARPEWHTPLLGIIFIISALLCGLASLVILKSYCVDTAGIENNKPFSDLARRLSVFLLLLDVVMIFLNYGIGRRNTLIQESQSIFPILLLLSLIIGNALPVFLILVSKKNKIILNRIVPVLILAGVLLKRADIIISAYFRRWIPLAFKISYVPTFSEILIVLGVYSAAILAIMAIFYSYRQKLK
jgi:molybdopterin-containing oxidoreductase family membrane subunit